jgi:hypothetical protein
LVEPPVAAYARDRVLECRTSENVSGIDPRRNRFITTAPQSYAIWSLCGSMAGTLLKPMGERPIISITVDMVLAV